MRNDLDSLFSKGLNNYSSDVPDHVWKGIAGAINKPENGKKRWLLWIVILSLLLLTAAFLAYKFNNARSSESPAIQSDLALFHEEYSDSEQIKVPEKSVPFEDEQAKGILSSLSNVGPTSKNQNSGHAINRPLVSGRTSMSSSDGLLESLKEVANPSEFVLANKSPDKSLIGRSGKLIYIPAIEGKELFVSGQFRDFRNRSRTLGDCYDVARSVFMIEFNLGLDYPIRSLRTVGLSEEYSKYLDERKSTESGFISYHAALKVGYIHASGLLAKSGFQYTEVNDRFLLIKENVIKIKTLITIDTMYNSDGSTTITRDTSIIEELGREKMRTINHFRMFDIPLIVGYKHNGLNYSLEFNAGVIFNIASSQSGRIYNTDIIPEYYGTKGNGTFSPYKTKLGLSIYGGVTMQTQLSDHFYLTLEPNARYYFSSFTNPAYPLRQNYFVFGVSSGLRYYF